jgi:PAS domain S-box-containing protein
MKHEKSLKDNTVELRKQAEKTVREQSDDNHDPAQLSHEETQRLIQELRVHQIELEMQNEELRKTEFELTKTTDEYTDLYDHAPVGYLTLSENGIISNANLTLAKLTGTERARLINAPFDQFVGFDSQDNYYLYLNQLLDGKENQTAELKLKKRDGSEFYALLESSVIEESESDVREFRVTVTDITERKQAEEQIKANLKEKETLLNELRHEITGRKQSEEALKESEERYKFLVENARESIISTGIDGKLLFINKAGADILGGKPEDFVGKTAWDLLPKEIADARIAKHSKIIQSGKDQIEEYSLPFQGETRWFSASRQPIRNSSGDVVSILTIATDITDRKQAEKQIKKSQLLLKSSIENSKMPILSIDKQYCYLYFNSIHKDAMVSAYKKNIEIGMNLLDCIPSEEDRKKSKANFDYALAGNYHVTIEEYGDFERLFYETRYIPILDDDSEIIGATAFIEDITSRKLTEEKVKTSLKEKETLLHEIHHRVKNNMTVISSLLKLQAGQVDNDQAKAALMDSQNRVQSMSTIHETLYQSDNLSAVDMNTYLSNLAKAIAQNYSFGSKVNLLVESKNVLIGAKQASPIGLIVNELITNSYKYAFPDNQEGEIKINLQKIENQIQLEYADDGIGIPEDYNWRNTKSMGLNLVKMLAENQLDGSIDMESNSGTKFTIKFNIDI